MITGYGDYEVAVYEDRLDLDYDEWILDLEEQMNADRFKADPKMFEAQLEEIEADTEGVYLFPQAGKTKVKLLLAPERIMSTFYEPVLRSWQGKERLQYMMPVVINDNNVKIMVVAKTVHKGIIQLLANGWDLFDPDLGHGIVIDRTGEGIYTRYTVTTTPNPVAIDYESLNWYEDVLTDYARTMEANDREEGEPELVDDDLPF